MKNEILEKRDFITGYATALQDIMFQITRDNKCAKSYDPCTIDDVYIRSYAYNLKDGGKHHPIQDYSSVEEITELMLKETTEDILQVIKID